MHARTDPARFSILIVHDGSTCLMFVLLACMHLLVLVPSHAVPLQTLTAASVSPALYAVSADAAQVDLPDFSLSGSTEAGTDKDIKPSHLTNVTVSQPSHPSASDPSLRPPTMDSIHDLVHAALQRLLHLMPGASSTLFPILAASFPHKRQESTAQLIYVKNLLRVSEYAPSLRDRILTTIIERMIHIDVEIVHTGEDDEDEEDEDADDDGSDTPADDESMSQRGASILPLPSPSKPLSESRQMANKLDSLMCLMFEYLHLIRQASEQSRSSRNNQASAAPMTPGALLAQAKSRGSDVSASGSQSSHSTSASDLCDEVFSSLLRVFERSILRTHNSRFLQFLLFYYTSFSHTYAEAFLSYLLERGFEGSVSAVERQNAALYIASFVARAAFLRHASALHSFELLLKWTHAYTQYHITTSEASMRQALSNSYVASERNASLPPVPEVGPLEANQHAVFYRLAQAVLYIFCYRQASFRDMLESNPQLLSDLQLDKLIFSPLNPLRYIANTVVDEFLRVNRRLGDIVPCEELVNRNRKLNQAMNMHATPTSNSSNTTRNNRANLHNPTASRMGMNSSGVGNVGVSGGGLSSGGSVSVSANRFDPNEAFFPFDPYQLKHSAHYIDDIYIEYNEEGEDDGEEDEDIESDDYGGVTGVTHSPLSLALSSAPNSPLLLSSTRPIPIRLTPAARVRGVSSTASASDGHDRDGYDGGVGGSVSSMSASFSDQLAVSLSDHDHEHRHDTSHDVDPNPDSNAISMSFEMESSVPIHHQPSTKSTKHGTKSATRRNTKNGSGVDMHDKRRNQPDEHDASDAHGFMLTDQDFSFSPNSPLFGPLEMIKASK